MNNVLITAPNIEQEKYWKIKCEKEKHYYHPIKLEDHGLSWKVAYIEKYIERKVEELLEYGEESRQELLETLKVINPWVFNLFIKINAPELRLSEICFYLSNVINLRVKCAEGKNTEYKKKISGMKFTEARDVSEILRLSPNLVPLPLSSSPSTWPATSSTTTSSSSSRPASCSTTPSSSSTSPTTTWATKGLASSPSSSSRTRS